MTHNSTHTGRGDIKQRDAWLSMFVFVSQNMM